MAQDMFLSDEELKEVYEWVDTFQLSRIKRNINRDFSDGVLVAEILSVYHPSLVELHNYSQVHSYQDKIGNWNLMRKKVLSKIGFDLEDDEIYSLVRAERGHIEILLLRLKH